MLNDSKIAAYTAILQEELAGGIAQQRTALGVPPHQIQGAAHHVPAAGGDDGVGLGVDGAAQLVAVVIRDTPTEYRVIDVQREWIDQDDSLPEGYKD